MFTIEHFVPSGTSGLVMSELNARLLGANIKAARTSAELTQAQLAGAAKIHRLQILRMESGIVMPQLDEAIRIAGVLKVPLEWLMARRWSMRTDLQGIAFELYHLGIRDLEVANPQVPGSFRRPEEVLVLALSGDRPEPRVVEAIPFLLARQTFEVPLAHGFACVYDNRVLTRLAWLSEVTLALGQSSTMPLSIEIRSQPHLRAFVESVKPSSDSDSLGHPSQGTLAPIWRRWHITYAGTLQDFLRRTIEVDLAYQASRTMTEGSW
jgi:transcriptional regulator with XRE-family HTH domain